MPQLSILREMKEPELWVPIPHMYGVRRTSIILGTVALILLQGFFIKLIDQSLEVTIFETVPGHVRPRETNLCLRVSDEHHLVVGGHHE